MISTLSPRLELSKMDRLESRTFNFDATTTGKAPREPQDVAFTELVNASGHKQELERNFSLVNICAIAITTGNTWVAIGGSVVSCFMIYANERREPC